MDRIVSQLMTELDALSRTDGLFVLAATNRLSYLCILTPILIHACTRTHANTYTNTEHAYTYTHTYTHTYAYTQTCTYTCAYACIRSRRYHQKRLAYARLPQCALCSILPLLERRCARPVLLSEDCPSSPPPLGRTLSTRRCSGAEQRVCRSACAA